MLRVSNIAVSIGKVPILSDVSLTVSPGDFAVVIGPNGAGKSTLVKAISGELRPSSGEIHINELPVCGTSPARMAMHRAVLPQASTLSFPFTVYEVIRLGMLGGMSGVAREQTDWLILEALARVDLAGFEGRYFQELSGGEKQRVHLARALCQVWTPVYQGVSRFLILDEPTSSLDIRHQLAILALAKDYTRAGGGAVAVLHDLNVAAMFADRIVVLDRGRVCADGPPGEILTNALVETVFGLPARVNETPGNGTPYVLPQTAVPAVRPDTWQSAATATEPADDVRANCRQS